MATQKKKMIARNAKKIFTPLVVAVGFGISGSIFIVASHAATVKALKTGQLSSALVNNSGKVMCLDDYKNRSANLTPVNVYPCNTKDAGQKWQLYSDNTIRIHGKCLDVYRNSKTNGAKIDLYTCNGGKNQQWTAGTNVSLSLNNLVSKASGKCLDVYRSQTANNSRTDLYKCNGTAAQVWGWNTNGKIVRGGSTVAANCHGSVVGGNTCYYWVGAYQQNNDSFSASGVSADFTQGNPKINPYVDVDLNHSIIEIYAASADGKQAVEIGWYAGNGAAPMLFATVWVNSEFIGYAENGGTGFVPVSTTMHVGDKVKVGATGTYKIQYASSQWQIWYNGVEVGYFPESVWSSRGASYTSIGWVSPYGEVADSLATIAKTQMGTGILGSKSGAAAISNYTLIGSSTPAKLTDFYEPSGVATSRYDYGSTSSTGMTLGGPGF
jgi:Ricin-type beta-trefoil lectin domain